MNRLHERCLQTIYRDKKSSIDELLDKDEAVSSHHQNIQKLGIQMFKALNGGNPQLVNEILRIRDAASYELRQKFLFSYPFSQYRFQRYRKNTISNALKTSCPCRICKTYVHGVEFL